MRHWRILNALLLIVSFTSVHMAQKGNQLEDRPWIKEVASQRIVYAVPGMEEFICD